MKTLGKITALFAALIIAAPAAMGQGRKELRINEVMIDNQTSIIDNYGNRGAWIEVINPTHAAIEINSIYLTNDPENPTKYFVPRGDADTKVGKGQSVIFHADNQPNHGTFHLNFSLTPGQDNFIAIYDADGINLIDSVTIPASLTANCSYARTVDADGNPVWEVRDDSSEAKAITPGGSNDIKGPNNKIKQFKEMDSHGFAMSGTAMTIVFGALLVLCLCFIMMQIRKQPKKKEEPAETPKQSDSSQSENDAEVAAAIAMALHQHLNAGVGNSRLTITHNPSSAWTSKIQAMRQLPRK